MGCMAQYSPCLHLKLVVPLGQLISGQLDRHLGFGMYFNGLASDLQ